MPRDTIITYVYINEVTAVRFNTRTNLKGRFPVDITKKVNPQPYEKVEIFIAINPPAIYDSTPSYFGYMIGQYVRVCRWEKDMHWAYGFNLSTLAMGRFDVRYQFKKVEWHEET